LDIPSYRDFTLTDVSLWSLTWSTFI